MKTIIKIIIPLLVTLVYSNFALAWTQPTIYVQDVNSQNYINSVNSVSDAIKANTEAFQSAVLQQKIDMLDKTCVNNAIADIRNRETYIKDLDKEIADYIDKNVTHGNMSDPNQSQVVQAHLNFDYKIRKQQIQNYWDIVINTCTGYVKPAPQVSANIKADSNFVNYNATKINGGSISSPIAQFILNATGEDVKIDNLAIFSSLTGMPSNTGLSNVSLFLNGGKISTSQNITGQSIVNGVIFDLGQSFIIPAEQAVVLTIKADIVNPLDLTAYTSGTITMSVRVLPSDAHSLKTGKYLTVGSSAVNGQTITIIPDPNSNIYKKIAPPVIEQVQKPQIQIKSTPVQAETKKSVVSQKIKPQQIAKATSSVQVSSSTVKVRTAPMEKKGLWSVFMRLFGVNKDTKNNLTK